MDAINSLPIKAPVAPAQKPRTEAASDHGSQNSSFENLLDEKSAPSGEPAAVGTKAAQADDPAKAAEGTDVPVNVDVSTLLAMFPLLPTPPILPTLPLQPEPTAPAPSAEAAIGKGMCAPAAPALPLPTTDAVETLVAEALPRQITTPLNSASSAPDAETKAAFEAEIPKTAPVIIPSLRPTAAPAVESFAVAAPAPAPVQASVTAETVVHGSLEVGGTSAAMQNRVMPEPVKSRATEPKTAALSADRSAPESVASPVEIRLPVPAQKQDTTGEHGGEKPGFQPPPNDAPAPVATFANSFAAPAAAADEPAAVSRTQTETIVHRTMDAAERLRVTGGERVEVQIKLDAGQTLTVRLQLVHGEVKPIFLTDSHELRQAIEQNWSQFSDRGADRNVRLTTPVFESPNSQSGMNDLNQQQREGRQRAFADAQEAAFAGNVPFGRNLPRRTNAAAPSAAPVSGVRLYA